MWKGGRLKDTFNILLSFWSSKIHISSPEIIKKKCSDSNIKPSAAVQTCPISRQCPREEVCFENVEARIIISGKQTGVVLHLYFRLSFPRHFKLPKTFFFLSKTVYIKAELYGQLNLFGIFGKIYIHFFSSPKVVINNLKFGKNTN